VIWPDNQRRLEHEFERGDLTPEEYRFRRAQRLSQVETPAQPTPAQPPVQPASWPQGPVVNGHPPFQQQPPRPPEPSPDWIQQGPDEPWLVGRTRKIAYAVAGVLLVVVATVGLVNSGDSGSTAQPQQQPQQQPPIIEQQLPGIQPLPEPPAAKPEPTQSAAALVDPPGQARPGGGTFDITKLETAKYLPDSVIQRLKQGGMTDGVLKTTVNGPVTLSLLALHMPDASSTTNAAREYMYTEQEGGVIANRELSMHGVPVFSAPSADGTAAFRGVYILYTRVIIVDVSGPQEQGKSAFQAMLDAQVRNAPPTDRTIN
jgi:hypothetical protein